MLHLNADFFPAHIRISDDGQETRQTVTEHCRQTAAFAAEALRPAGLKEAACLAGLLHDMGKMRARFANYLNAAAHGEPVRKGSVNHTFAAVRFLLEQPKRFETLPAAQLCAELLAYAAGAHHGEFDIAAPDGSNGFQHRLNAEDLDYDEVVQNYLAVCAPRQELEERFAASSTELEQVVQRISALCRDDETGPGEQSFYFGLLARLLLSAVIEGDRRDTAAFLLAPAPRVRDGTADLWQTCLRHAERMISALPNQTPVERARHSFSERCAELASRPGGLYQLNLPTGGGKTLSSLRGALAHAAAHGKRRIIYVIPLLSVLDQNAAIIRDYLGQPELVLEHHSNLVRERAEGELDPRELMLEDWGAPVIITTLVQLLNTLYDGRTSCIRRMQALCDSVLIIDEVQSVPPRLLTLFHLAVNFLAGVCRATVILCSATVPSTEKAPHPYFKAPESIVPYDPALWAPFQRTKILPPERCRLDHIGSLLRERLTAGALLVCNTRAEAAAVYGQMEGIERYHLSASMCMAHRRQTLEQISAALRDGRPFVCVSTQVIECGVDLSFQSAARFLAGMDSILQTAGRCNRHGESGTPAEIRVLQCEDERLTHLADIRDGKTASAALFDAFARNPAAFGGDLTSAQAMQFYYSKRYSAMPRGAQDGPVKGLPTLFELLSENEHFFEKCEPMPGYLAQAFATAGEHFAVFEQDTCDLLVPYGAGAALIAELESERAYRDLGYAKALSEQAKPYTVSIYQYQKDLLISQGALREVCGILVLCEGWYSDALGLATDKIELEFQEV